jgi:hypothetical protein
MQGKGREDGEGDSGLLILGPLQTSGCHFKTDNSSSLGGTSKLGQEEPSKYARRRETQKFIKIRSNLKL